MIKFLNDIRNAEKPISNNRKIINTIAVLFLGIALGTFSKFLDFRQAELPSVLMAIDGALDVHNFLGRFAIWVLIALCISIYSNSAIRASINVFAFFIGMVASYYLYSSYIAGFFPRSYAVIWFGFTAVVSGVPMFTGFVPSAGRVTAASSCDCEISVTSVEDVLSVMAVSVYLTAVSLTGS